MLERVEFVIGLVFISPNWGKLKNMLSSSAGKVNKSLLRLNSILSIFLTLCNKQFSC